MIAFEPTTMALGLALMEKAIRRPSRACCCVKLLLRRPPDIFIDSALNEAAEPFLDSLGAVLFHQAVDSFIITLAVSICFLLFNNMQMKHTEANEAQ